MSTFSCGTYKVFGEKEERDLMVDVGYVHHHGLLSEIKVDDDRLKLLHIKNGGRLTKIDIRSATNLTNFSVTSFSRLDPFDIVEEQPEPITTIKTLELPPNIETLSIGIMELEELYLPPTIKFASINYKTQIPNLNEFTSDPNRKIEFVR